MLGWRVKGGTDIKQGIGLLPISSTLKPTECKLIDATKGQLYPSGVGVEGFEMNCGLIEVVHSEKSNVLNGKISPILAYDDGKNDSEFCCCYD